MPGKEREHPRATPCPLPGPQTSDEPRKLIERLELRPHPEGGWFRETWRAEKVGDARASATAILFLLEEGQRSRWHRVDATELWLWHAGHPLRLFIAGNGAGSVRSVTLGADVLAGATPQHVIAPDAWQTAEAIAGWALVSCIVSPGFEFSGFQLAPDGWSPGSSVDPADTSGREALGSGGSSAETSAARAAAVGNVALRPVARDQADARDVGR